MSSSFELEMAPLLTADARRDATWKFNAYVHVAYGYDAAKWRERWHAGKVLGLNEEMPYGYHRAAQYGASVVYSRDYPENPLQKLIRYGFRAVLGFDLVHAWRNRREIWRSDVVWTHTESQSLAVLALLAFSKGARRPKLIGQVVWLIDEWRRLGMLRRASFKWLLGKADILTFLSPANAQAAAKLFPDRRIEFVKFGINTDFPTLPHTPPKNRKLRVLSLGNDRHRDWSTLIDAVSGEADIELRILTTTYKLKSAHDNITVMKVDSNQELLAQFEWADMLVLTLKPNFHASGITVIEEAVILGVPVICTNVGGLDAYFSEGEVIYIDAFAPDQVRAAIRRLAQDADLQRGMISAAKQRMVDGKISSVDYVRRHAELTAELCGAEAHPARKSAAQ